MTDISIQGLTIIKDFITREEEIALLDSIDRQAWDSTLTRRTQHYGFKYVYTKRTVDTPIDPLPEWISFVTSRLQQHQIFPAPPQQLIINEYLPGQGIGRHVDSSVFGEPIVSISLLSPCVMIFRSPEKSAEIDLVPRSALILRGPARSSWTHEIPARKTDFISLSQPRLRARRVSLTFRVMK